MVALARILAFSILVAAFAGCADPEAVELPPIQPAFPSEPWFHETAILRGVGASVGPDTFETPMLTMGGGVAVADVDGDGAMDFYVTMPGANALYMNRGDGTFQEAAAARGLADSGVGRASVFFDYDNDGDADVYVGNIQGTSTLYRNDDGMFTDVGAASGTLADLSVHAVAAADVDLDGNLDLFVGNYGRWWESEDQGYAPTADAMVNHLYMNNGDGTFTESGQARGLTEAAWTLAASFADVDQDGDSDLMVANDFGGLDHFYWNEGGTFVQANTATGIQSARDGMGIIWADFNGDLELDVYVSNIFSPSDPSPERRGNTLWAQDQGKFRDVAIFAGVNNALWSWGGVAFDAEADGDLDLYVPNGFNDAEPEMGIHEMEPSYDGKTQPNRFYENRGWGRFLEVGSEWGLDQKVDGRGSALIDLEGDGDLDIVTTAHGSRVMVLENQAPQGNSIRILLEGTDSNRDAIGATVYVEAGGITQMRHRVAGSGYMSQDQPWIHVGMSYAPQGDVRVVWPGGEEQTFDGVNPGAYHLRQGGKLVLA